MHIFLQSINHMNEYNSFLRRSMINSALRDNLVSSTQVYQSVSQSISLKVPLILQFVLSALFSPSHYLLSSFSKESIQTSLLSVAHSLKFQVPLDKLVRQFEREMEMSHTHLWEKILYCKRAPRRGTKKLKCF